MESTANFIATSLPQHRGRNPHPKSINTKNTAFTRTFREVCTNFCVLPYDMSQEASRNWSGKLDNVQIHFRFWVDFLGWLLLFLCQQARLHLVSEHLLCGLASCLPMWVCHPPWAEGNDKETNNRSLTPNFGFWPWIAESEWWQVGLPSELWSFLSSSLHLSRGELQLCARKKITSKINWQSPPTNHAPTVTVLEFWRVEHHLSGPVRDTPPYRATPFRDSIAEGGYRTLLPCFHSVSRNYRWDTPFWGGGYRTSTSHALKGGNAKKRGRGYRTQLALLRHQKPHSAQ